MGKCFHHLTYNDRLKIDLMLRLKHSKKEIAKEIGCSIQTIYREIKRATYVHTNSDLTEEIRYNPDGAHRKYRQYLSEKGRGRKAEGDQDFRRFVENKILQDKYSPVAVYLYMKCNEDALTFPTRVCPSTIYNYIREGFFEHLTLADCPVPRKKTSKKKKVQKQQKRVSRGTSIEKRPAEVAERNVPGHWEMDTVVGARGKSKKSLLVLTERVTLTEIVEPLKEHTADEVVKALNRIERELGEKRFRETFKSITVDNGAEFSDYERMEMSRRNKKKRTKVFYCHPYCSFERALNENQNRLIRRFVPKGTVFDDISRKEVKDIQDWINNYPRTIFKGKTSHEIYKKVTGNELWRQTA